MKRTILFFLVFCFNFSLFAQYEIKIEAQVLDYYSKQPIPYVNIEFANKDLKTVTDKNGFFILSYDEEYVINSDVLKFKTFGYKSQQVSASQFYKFLKNTNKIYLVPNDNLFQKTTEHIVVSQNKTQNKGSIYGIVTSEDIPLQGATIKLKNSFSETVTNTQGAFNINAKDGDVLVVSFLGMKQKEVLVDTEQNINILLESDGLLLDEVVVEGKAKKEELIDLGLGIKKSFDAIGTSVSVITADDIKPHYYDLGDVLRGKFASLNKSRETSMTNLQGIIFDIDGMIVAPPSPLPNIDVQNIESITILTSLAATNKYGTLGRGGVILIRTKIMSAGKAKQKPKPALVTGNDYNENLPEFNYSTKPNLNTNKVHGIISSNSGVIQSATIQVKHTFTEVKTNVKGYYEINAKEGDVLAINYLGMLTKEVEVSHVKTINVVLQPDGQLLDEVVVEGKTREEKLIDLGAGQKKSFDALGYSVNVLEEKDIKPQYLNFQDLLVGKFAGVTTKISTNVGDPPVIYLRSTNSIADKNLPAIYDIDGSVYETWPNIEVQNIKSVTILKSLASVTKYGTIGRGGVIVIKTKTASYDEVETKKKFALAQGNSYEENLNNFNNTNHTSSYIKALKKATSFKTAKGIYLAQQNSETQLGIPYYLEVSDYFLKWDQSFSERILNTISKIAINNAKALLTLAYKLEAQHKFENAKTIYQRIALLRPNDAQTYRNLAHIYERTGYYQSAMDLYKQMLSNNIKDVDFKGLESVLANELAHLVALHRNKVDYKDLPTDFLSAKFKFDTRIVFEWNEPTTEFELQFVNPMKKFYKWSHTQLDNRERMMDEIRNGYATEEYIIDDAEIGEWLINIESLAEEKASINPTYLKYTVYKNYGLPNETQDIKVVKLSDCKPKVTFDKLVSN